MSDHRPALIAFGAARGRAAMHASHVQLASQCDATWACLCTFQPFSSLAQYGVALMKDRERALAAARDKRELATFVRRVAATMSLKADRDALLRQATNIEAEARDLERDAGGDGG